jgi:hypothetical protein
VEWLSVGTLGQSGDDAEAQQNRAAVTWRHGDRRCDGLESWRWVRITVVAWRVRSGSDLEARGGFGCHMDGKRFYILIMDQFWKIADPLATIQLWP